MPMFDLENVKKTDLEGNRTTSEEFLKMRGGGELRAVNNEAGQEKKKSWLRDLLVAVVAGLIVLAVTILVYYFCPKLK